MKKRISILLCVILATTLLAACAAGGSANMTYRDESSADSMAPQAAPPVPVSDSIEMELGTSGGGSTGASFSVTSEDDGGWYEPASGESDIVAISSPSAEAFIEKIIYSVYADIETITFDETIDKVHALMQNYGAFIENSSISGVNYTSKMHGWVEFRYAHFSLRVPKENLDGITANLDDLGNVTHRNSNAMNITSQFYDTQSRLISLRVQEERLLDMLSKAADVPDLIMIEERLSDVRYQIESLTTTLNNWQQQVDFSTLTLNIREVEEYSEPVLIHRTYWEQIGDGFMATMRGVGRFFMDLFRWLIVSAPVLLILAFIGIVIYIIIRRQMRKIEEKRKKSPSKPAYMYQPHVYTPQVLQEQQTQPVQQETPLEQEEANTEQAESGEEQEESQPEYPEMQPDYNESLPEQTNTENENE